MITTAPRVDIHRPSAEQFDPEAYECRGVFDLGNDYGKDERARRAAVDAMLAAGFRFASHQQIGQCGHCGAYLRYAALLTHGDSHEMIYVGETCLAGRFESLTKAEFQRLRKAAALDSARARERSERVERIAALVTEHPVLADLTYPQLDDEHSPFVADVAARFRSSGYLSERQVAAVSRAIHREANDRVERATEQAACPDVAAPAGKVDLAGVVLSTRIQHGQFGAQYKMLLKVTTDSGAYRVWSTIPSAVMNAQQGPLSDLRGRSVRMRVTLSPSHDDPAFAFGSRPTQAALLPAE